MVRILGFHCRGPGSIPGQGNEIPQAVQHGQKKKKKKKKKKMVPVLGSETHPVPDEWCVRRPQAGSGLMLKVF